MAIARGYAIQTTFTSTKPTYSGHSGLVLPPLFITMIFCFALVLIQQHQADVKIAATKQQQTYQKSPGKLSTPTIKTITPLSPIVVAPPPAAAAANSANPKVDAPPQPSKTSGSAVQGGGQNNKPDSVIDKVAQPVRNATGIRL